MTKKFIFNYFILIVLLITATIECSALQNQVLILNLEYNQGNISIINKVVNYGYYPDRNYMPIDGYTLQTISKDNKILYNMRFKAPNEIYVDGTDKNGVLTGGLILLNKTNFSIVVPYSTEIENVKIYDVKNKLKTNFIVKDKTTPFIFSFFGYIIMGIVLCIVIFLILLRKRSKN